MRILVLHSRYRSGPVSGENRVVDDEARLLREAGHEVEVYSPIVGGGRSIDRARAATSMVWSLRAANEVAARIEERRPDIVHVHNLFPALSPSVLRACGRGIACVMTLHNYRLLCLPGTFLRDGRVCEDCLDHRRWPGIVHGCYQGSVAASATLAGSIELHRRMGSFDRIDLLVAISGFVKAMHVGAGIDPGRVVVKPHFAWPSKRRSGPGSHFLYLGRLSPEKGVRTLVKAWDSVGARLKIVGEGPERGFIRSGASPSVELDDPVPPERVPDLLVEARALIVPSLSHEGAGKVVLEAYAAGVPVIASRAGGLPEVVEDGVTGLLVPPGDPTVLSAAAHHMLDDTVSERMGSAGWRRWSEQHRPSRGLRDLEDVYGRARRRARLE